MPPKHFAHLEHIRGSASYFASHSQTTYLADLQTRDVVERRFTIINRLRRDAPQAHAAISDTTQVAAFRNLIAHVSEHINHAVVWAVIASDFAVLHDEVVALLHDADRLR